MHGVSATNRRIAVLPSERYRRLQQDAGLRQDVRQEAALQRLDALQQRILAPAPWYRRGRLPLQGIYLWGSVGAGKSLLTDIFFDTLPPETGKTRLHYQHFMGRVHRELHALTGTPNPLQELGRRLAQEFRVICLDELYITDLGDAMIVYNLFDALFRGGVALLITSNFAPDKLYKDELQPAIFQPAIRVIRAHTEELQLSTEQDYRRLHAQDHPTWLLGPVEALAACFDALNREQQQSTQWHTDALDINGHRLQPLRRHDALLWFDFSELCEQPRSARDYIVLAQQCRWLLLSGVPQFGGHEPAPAPVSGTEDAAVARPRRHFSSSENAQRRFISLVDECYDQGLKLYLQSSVPLDALYAGGRLAFEFQRTLSRLAEMQTALYRDRPPRSGRPP